MKRLAYGLVALGACAVIAGLALIWVPLGIIGAGLGMAAAGMFLIDVEAT